MGNDNKELMSIVNELYKVAGEEYLRDSFFSEILESIRKVKWERDIVLEYGPQIEETVELLTDFSNRKYNRASRDEITILSTLLLYFINLQNTDYANEYYRSISTQKLFASTLFKTASSTFRTYREFKLVNNLFLKEKEVVPTRKQEVAKPARKPKLFIEDEEDETKENNKEDKIDMWGFNDLDMDGVF